MLGLWKGSLSDLPNHFQHIMVNVISIVSMRAAEKHHSKASGGWECNNDTELLRQWTANSLSSALHKVL